MKVAIAQINPIVADINGNNKKIVSYIKSAKKQGADIIIFPEIATIGYPPMDLLENKKLIDENIKSIEKIAEESKGIAVICGYVDYDIENPPMLFNSAVFINNGKIVSKHYKSLLPSYDVFYEPRHYSPARELNIINFNNKKIGITICEDIWNTISDDKDIIMENRKYSFNPVEVLIEKKVDMIINISASPFVKDKNPAKITALSKIAKKNSISIAYINQVGGNDNLIFDGNSLFINEKGIVTAHAKGFEEDLLIFNYSSNKEISIQYDELGEIRQALTLGIKDYVHKCGFKDVVIGLSGGIDSALTTVLAVEALGPENVLVITMPSIYSSSGSIDDSVKLAKTLGIKIETIPIQSLFTQFKKDLTPIFKNLPEDTSEENIQARIRGTLLMAVSNKTGCLLLSTGNKSELAMGYCTLYGDMSGGLAVISDLPKTLVYSLSRYINKDKEIIPVEIIEKPPSAELRENQKDQDSLPPYEILDEILECYIEHKMSANEIISRGFSEELVRKILHTVILNEYKRRQAAPGLKVTTKAFGSGRRIPIAQKFQA